jgi:hypothetical protein
LVSLCKENRHDAVQVVSVLRPRSIDGLDILIDVALRTDELPGWPSSA